MSYPITYKYNFFRDLKHSLNMLLNFRTWNKEGVVVFWPNPFRWIWLMGWYATSKKPRITEDTQYTVLFVHAGCWGEYRPGKNEIIICPWKIEESADKTLAELINHELTHLKHPEADMMEHQDKEKYIEDLQHKHT